MLIENNHTCSAKEENDEQKLVIDEGTRKEINNLIRQQLGFSAIKIYELFEKRLPPGIKAKNKFLRDTREKISAAKTPQTSVDPVKDASLVEVKGRSWDFARQYCSLKLSDGKVAKFLILMSKPQAKLFSKAQIIAADGRFKCQLHSFLQMITFSALSKGMHVPIAHILINTKKRINAHFPI